MAKLTFERLVDDDRLCNYCEWAIDGNINTNQFNLCEGRNCENAYESYLESGDDTENEEV